MRPKFHNRFNRSRGRNNRPFHNNRSSSNKDSRAVIRGIKILSSSVSPIERIETEYVSENTFNDFGIDKRLIQNIAYKGYTVPSPIQDKAIKHILANKDIIGIANTGTGKTAAFLIPLIQKVIEDRSETVLILVPTRELALQISNEMYAFTFETDVTWTVCIGGTTMKSQWEDLERDPHFIIGTPGRIKDFIQKKVIKMENFTRVVLDEADRMVDIGFIHEIKYFISLLSKDRQSLFFSATIPPKVDSILKSFVHDPITISVKTNDSLENIKQEIIEYSSVDEKIDELHNLLVHEDFKKVIIFGRTKRGVQKLSDELNKRGFKSEAIHGNKNQNQRMRALTDFKNGKTQILLATDIASRGIDVQGITHVINYDIPTAIEDYVHRIGRTGRAQSKGVAITFIPKESY